MQCAALCVGSEELPQLGFVPHGCVPVAIDAPQPPADASAASLAAHGWRVAVVDYRAWEVQQAQKQQEEYLRSLLAQ